MTPAPAIGFFRNSVFPLNFSHFDRTCIALASRPSSSDTRTTADAATADHATPKPPTGAIITAAGIPSHANPKRFRIDARHGTFHVEIMLDLPRFGNSSFWDTTCVYVFGAQSCAEVLQDRDRGFQFEKPKQSGEWTTRGRRKSPSKPCSMLWSAHEWTNKDVAF